MKVTVLVIRAGDPDYEGNVFTEGALVKMVEECSGLSWDYNGQKATVLRAYVTGGVMYADLDIPKEYLDEVDEARIVQ